MGTVIPQADSDDQCRAIRNVWSAALSQAKNEVTGWSAQMYTDPGCSLAKAADHPLTNPPGTKAGSTNDWMGIIGEIRRCAACELGDEVAKSRWPRTQPVNRVLPLTVTFK